MTQTRHEPSRSSETVRGAPLNHEFSGLLRALSNLGATEGLKLTPFEDPALIHFSSLPSENQAALVQQLKMYIEVMQEILRDDRHLLNNANSLWRMIGRLGWRPVPDLFSKVTSEDVIEIYDRQGHQLFRSLNFFPLCTYSLEEIYTRPWFVLYERDEETAKANLAIAADVFSNPQKGTRPHTSGLHMVRENKRPFRRCTCIKPGVISPLLDCSGEVTGFVNTFRPIDSVDEQVTEP